MREILFKAKRLDNGEWAQGDLIHGQGNKQGKMYILPQTQFYPNGCSNLDGWDVDPETVCQYTGLTDKNGVKIWEADVNEDLGVCFWNKDTAQFQWCYLNDDLMEFEDEKDWCIIIGNIFDNPELLKH